MIARTDVLAHLERGMRVGFLNGTKAYTPMRSAFVDEAPSDGAFETYADMGAVPWPSQNGGQSGSQGTDGRTGGQVVGGLHEGGAITVLGGNERAMTVYNRDWDIPIGIWHSAIDDNRVGSLEQWARTAGSRFEQHKDYLAFQALNAGEGTTYGKGYDGQPFFSNSHTDPGAEYQTAQDNQYTLSLSNANFKTVYVASSSYKDDRGIPVGLFHNLLVHAIELIDEAEQVVRNPQKSGTANREVNPFDGRITNLAAPGGWLDSDAWFTVSTQPGMKPLGLQVRKQPELTFWDDYSQGGGIRYYKWMARYEIFYRDWRMATQGNT